MGALEPQCHREHFLGAVPDRWTLRRFHDVLHILQGGLDNAAGRSDRWICDICRRKRPYRNRIGRTRLLYCQITLEDEKQNRTREAYRVLDDTPILPQERGQQEPLRGVQQA